MSKDLRIILSGGGTLGSVSPLLAIAENLPAKYLFVGTDSGPEKTVVLSYNIEFRAITAGKLRRYFDWQNFKDLFKIKLGIYQSLKIIKEFKPDIILTAGSFVCVPMAVAAKLKGIPVIVHQQDLTLGLANKIMTPLAKKITVTFPEQLKFFPQHKTVLTGNPVRTKLVKTDDKPIVLITGGGLGARNLNDFIKPFILELLEKYQVHHILGDANWDQRLELSGYTAYRLAVKEINDLLNRADIIISRSGMSLISEAAFLKKALVLVPIPNTHQEKNAEFFAKHNAACYVPQGNHQIMDRYLYKLMNNDTWRIALGENLYNLYPENAVGNYQALIKEILR
jgi:UDP-N-acetylglucosamine--N-acetylmuramyl-(pentapeptide) pyrophosphoryl-undecaprenol N-acetylglucosamine transferase